MAMRLYGQQFAAEVLLISLLVYSPGLVVAFDLAHDADVRFWFGEHPALLALALPFLFLVVFVGHLHSEKPRQLGLYVSIVLPCAYFFFLGFWLLFQVARSQDIVTADTCQAFEMQFVESSWLHARDFHATCTAQHVAALGPPPGLDQCPGYETELYDAPGRERVWSYLHQLELSSGCAGWCYRGPHLWVKDWGDAVSCSQVVAGNLERKLSHLAHQLMVYAAVALVAGLLWMYKMQPVFQLQKRQLAKENLYWYVPSS